jgi:hypothetical protein
MRETLSRYCVTTDFSVASHRPRCGRYQGAGRSFPGRETGNQAEDVADLKTRDQHGEFENLAQPAVVDIRGSDKNST